MTRNGGRKRQQWTRNDADDGLAENMSVIIISFCTLRGQREQQSRWKDTQRSFKRTQMERMEISEKSRLEMTRYRTKCSALEIKRQSKPP